MARVLPERKVSLGGGTPKGQLWDFYKPNAVAGDIDLPVGRKQVSSPLSSLVSSPAGWFKNIMQLEEQTLSSTGTRSPKLQIPRWQAASEQAALKVATGRIPTLRDLQKSKQVEEIERRRAKYPKAPAYAFAIEKEREREWAGREEIIRQAALFAVSKKPLPSSADFIRAKGREETVHAVRSASPLFKQTPKEVASERGGILSSLPKAIRGEDGLVEGLTANSGLWERSSSSSMMRAQHGGGGVGEGNAGRGGSRFGGGGSWGELEGGWGSRFGSGRSWGEEQGLVGDGGRPKASSQAMMLSAQASDASRGSGFRVHTNQPSEEEASFESFYTGSVVDMDMEPWGSSLSNSLRSAATNERSGSILRKASGANQPLAGERGKYGKSVRLEESCGESSMDEGSVLGATSSAMPKPATSHNSPSALRHNGHASTSSVASSSHLSQASSTRHMHGATGRSMQAVKHALEVSYGRHEHHKLFPTSQEGLETQKRKLLEAGVDSRKLLEAGVDSATVSSMVSDVAPRLRFIAGSSMSGGGALNDHTLRVDTAFVEESYTNLQPLTKGAGRPPYAIEGPFDPLSEDEAVKFTRFGVPEGTVELSHRGTKEEQFAWWSKHWCKKLEISQKKPPIKPVDKIWLGNFQRREVPLRKEQLGSFPSYRDFPWPPPKDVGGVGAKMGKFFDKLAPYGQDRLRFVGSGEKTTNRMMRDDKLLPDFLTQSGDLSERTTTTPAQFRTHAAFGWGGYKQARPNERYDVMSKRAFSRNVDRLIGIVCDKLTEHGVKNFSLAFKGFDADRSGKIDEKELQTFFIKWSIIVTAEECKEIFQAFIDLSKPREDADDTQIDIFDFVAALNKHVATHPLDPQFKNGPSLG